MIDAGKSMGLNDGVSAMLVKQTMLGAFHMMNQADGSLDDLIKAVASKGGTTEAALSVFDNQQVGRHIEEAIYAAENRARELSK
jgi:pyrroline-5-carboxylate reductase